MAPSPRTFSGRGVCSKSAAHNPTFPFPRRWAPDDEHSIGTKASNLRPWRCGAGSEFFRAGFRGEPERKGRVAAGGGKKREREARVVEEGIRRRL